MVKLPNKMLRLLLNLLLSPSSRMMLLLSLHFNLNRLLLFCSLRLQCSRLRHQLGSLSKHLHFRNYPFHKTLKEPEVNLKFRLPSLILALAPKLQLRLLPNKLRSQSLLFNSGPLVLQQMCQQQILLQAGQLQQLQH